MKKIWDHFLLPMLGIAASPFIVIFGIGLFILLMIPFVWFLNWLGVIQ